MSKELQTAPVAWILAYDDLLQGKKSLQTFFVQSKTGLCCRTDGLRSLCIGWIGR